MAERLALTWDEIHGIMERAVARGLQGRKAQPLPVLGIDEKAFSKRQRYFTLVNDLERSRVLYLAEDPTKASLGELWLALTEEQRESIQAVATEMWDPYPASVRGSLPDAEGRIVFDKFHIAKELGEGLERVRRGENEILRAGGDDRLAGTHYDWLRHAAATEPKDRRESAELRQSSLKTARAWALKEVIMAFFTYVYQRAAWKHSRWWYKWAVRSRLQPMIEVARMPKRRFENIVPYLHRRVTNPVSEGLNSKVQCVKFSARGFRNKDSFITAIYFHCGGLGLAP